MKHKLSRAGTHLIRREARLSDTFIFSYLWVFLEVQLAFAK